MLLSIFIIRRPGLRMLMEALRWQEPAAAMGRLKWTYKSDRFGATLLILTPLLFCVGVLDARFISLPLQCPIRLMHDVITVGRLITNAWFKVPLRALVCGCDHFFQQPNILSFIHMPLTTGRKWSSSRQFVLICTHYDEQKGSGGLSGSIFLPSACQVGISL